MQEKGIVNFQNESEAEISIIRQSACGASCRSCSSNCEKTEMKIKVRTDLKLNTGDIVTIETKTSKIMTSVLIAYVVPLMLLMIGTIGGTYIFKEKGIEYFEALGFITGVIFLVISFFIIRYLGNKYSKEEFEIIKVEKNRSAI